MVVSGVQAQILQALRAGEIGASEVNERWGSSNMLRLINSGYVSRRKDYEEGAVYKITDLGRKHCPSRNPLLNKVNAGKAKPLPAQIARVAPAASVVTVQTMIKQEKERDMKDLLNIPNKENEKPRTLQVLEYIEAHPDCTGAAIVDAFDFINPVSYLKLHIKSKKVIRTEIVGKRRGYTLNLAQGLTAEDIFSGGVKNRGGRPKKATTENKQTANVKPLTEVLLKASEQVVAENAVQTERATTAAEVVDIPAFLRKDLSNLSVSSEEFAKTTPSNVMPQLRFALTSNKTLMLMGKTNIELSSEETKRLWDFYQHINAGDLL